MEVAVLAEDIFLSFKKDAHKNHNQDVYFRFDCFFLTFASIEKKNKNKVGIRINTKILINGL